MFDYLMEKITFRRDLPYWFRQTVYYFLLFFLGKIRLVFKKESVECKKLIEDGIVYLGNSTAINLAPVFLKEEVLSCPFTEKFDNSGKILKKIYDQQALVQSKQVLDFALEQQTLEICTEFFNCLPSIAYIAAWETFADDEEHTSEMFFHMDHHGHRFLKKFCYLTNVSVGLGEHQFVKGTTERGGFNRYLKKLKGTNPDLHAALLLKRNQKGQFRLCNESIESSFHDRLLRVTGVPGTTFIEDTYGLHRGTPVNEDQSRLILQVVYVPWVLQKDSSKGIRINRSLLGSSQHRQVVMASSYSLVD